MVISETNPPSPPNPLPISHFLPPFPFLCVGQSSADARGRSQLPQNPYQPANQSLPIFMSIDLEHVVVFDTGTAYAYNRCNRLDMK